MIKSIHDVYRQMIVASAGLLLGLSAGVTSASGVAYKDPSFEIPVKTIDKSEEMIFKSQPPSPDGTREKYAKWELKKVDNNVYTFRGTLHRSMFVITAEGVVVVDPMKGWMAEGMLTQLAKLTDKKVTHVIYTHNHKDHVSGTDVFLKANPDLKIIAHQLAAEAMASFPNPNIVAPNTLWGSSKYTFTVGKENFELLYLGENHGSGMTFVGLPKRKLMYVADVMSPGRLPPGLMPDFSPRGEEATLAALAKLGGKYKRAVNAHESAAVSGWKAIEATLGYYRDVRVEVKKALVKTGTDMAPWEIVRHVQRLPKYANWKYYKQWYHPVAGRILMEEYLAY